MSDRRIREHPLGVRLRVGGQIAERGRHDGEDTQTETEYQRQLMQHAGRPRRDGHREPNQQRERGRLGPDGQKARDFGRGTLERIRAPEVKRHQRQLEREADHDHQQGEQDDSAFRMLRSESCREDRVQAIAQLGELGRPRQSGQQADSKQHDSRRSGTIHDELECGLAALPTPLQEAGQGIAGNAGHLNAEEQHEQMVGTRHQHHPDDRAGKQRVEIGGVLLVGNAAEDGQRDHEHQKEQQQAAQEDREHVVNGQSGEQLRRPAHEWQAERIQQSEERPRVLGQMIKPRDIDRIELQQHHNEGGHAAEQCDPVCRHDFVEARQSSQQQQHDRAGQNQLGQEQHQRTRRGGLGRRVAAEELQEE